MNENFLDIDFSEEPEFVFGDLGCPAFETYAAYEDVVGVLSDKEIDAAIEAMEEAGGGADQLVSRIFDQKREGSCVAQACAQAHEVTQALKYGIDGVVHLSAISLYKRIGRSASSGAMVSDGIKEMRSRGLLPLDTPENREQFGNAVMPNTGFRERFPSDWELTAAKFKGVEGNVIRSVDGIFSALCRHDPVVVGREGHSICYVRPMRVKGRLVAKYANSWSERWGEAGFGYDSSSQIKKSARWAFALRTVT